VFGYKPTMAYNVVEKWSDTTYNEMKWSGEGVIRELDTFSKGST